LVQCRRAIGKRVQPGPKGTSTKKSSSCAVPFAAKLIRRQFPLGGVGNKGMYRVEITDPEDPDYVPSVEEPKRRKLLAR
jgi:hypothetical protein